MEGFRALNKTRGLLIIVIITNYTPEGKSVKIIKKRGYLLKVSLVIGRQGMAVINHYSVTGDKNKGRHSGNVIHPCYAGAFVHQDVKINLLPG